MNRELGPSKVTPRDQMQWIQWIEMDQKHLLTKPCGTDADSAAANAKGVGHLHLDSNIVPLEKIR